MKENDAGQADLSGGILLNGNKKPYVLVPATATGEQKKKTILQSNPPIIHYYH